MNLEQALKIFDFSELPHLRELSDRYYLILRTAQLDSINPIENVRIDAQNKVIAVEAAYNLLKKELTSTNLELPNSKPQIDNKSIIEKNRSNSIYYLFASIILTFLFLCYADVTARLIDVSPETKLQPINETVTKTKIENSLNKNSSTEVFVTDFTNNKEPNIIDGVKFEVVPAANNNLPTIIDPIPKSTPSLEYYPTRDKAIIVKGNIISETEVVNNTNEFLSSVLSCNIKRTEELLKESFSVESYDERGDSALALAIRARCVPLVRLLLKKGAKVNSKSSNGFTPYVWARLYKLEEIAKILEDAGADKNDGWYWWRQDSDRKDQWVNNSLKNHRDKTVK